MASKTKETVTYVSEITVDLVTELFARNTAETYRAGVPYTRPIDRSIEEYLIRSRNFR